MNSTAPGSTFIIRSILFSYTKIPKIFVAYFYLLFYYQSIIYLLISLLDRREIDNLSFALGAKVCVLCASDVNVVLLGSPTGLITLVLN